MTERITTFQQQMVIQVLESLGFNLVDARANKRSITNQFRALWRLTDNDPRLPDILKPSQVFGNGESSIERPWDDRATLDEILDWVMRLHRHYELMSSKNIPR